MNCRLRINGREQRGLYSRPARSADGSERGPRKTLWKRVSFGQGPDPWLGLSLMTEVAPSSTIVIVGRVHMDVGIALGQI